LSVDVEGHGGIRLTEMATPVLKGEQTLTLRRLVRQQRKSRRDTSPVPPAQGPVWDALRRRRRELAEGQGVPAYVIFHDATLAEMAGRQPETLEEMASISGVGERKLADYGQLFLDVILAHRE
jgi:ATP-dependent DNA helicase RecQ